MHIAVLWRPRLTYTSTLTPQFWALKFWFSRTGFYFYFYQKKVLQAFLPTSYSFSFTSTFHSVTMHFRFTNKITSTVRLQTRRLVKFVIVRKYNNCQEHHFKRKRRREWSSCWFNVENRNWYHARRKFFFGSQVATKGLELWINWLAIGGNCWGWLASPICQVPWGCLHGRCYVLGSMKRRWGRNWRNSNG